LRHALAAIIEAKNGQMPTPLAEALRLWYREGGGGPQNRMAQLVGLLEREKAIPAQLKFSLPTVATPITPTAVAAPASTTAATTTGG
jgi:hypothetical protein